MQLILITGLSGSGKSVALNVLEDAGFYYVDNLPARLLPQTVGFLAESGHARAALSVELRSAEAIAELPRQLEEFRALGHDVRVLFLETKTDTLIKRFSETRRRHPLADSGLTLPECIERERGLLAGLAAIAARVDTSDLGPNTLRSWVKDFVGVPAMGLTLLFESFSYKQGIPLDADWVLDARMIANPHYDPQLRPLTGRDAPVIDFLERDALTQQWLGDVRALLARWLPEIVRENRSHVTVAIGCTGGRHRSVYLAEKLAGAFRADWKVLVRHRGLTEENPQ